MRRRGRLRDNGRAEQTHVLFAVIDDNGKPITVEAGVGFGMTPATDPMTLKLILSKDCN